MAPELLSFDSDSTKYTPSVDMYSFGMTIYALWSQNTPWAMTKFRGLELMLKVVQGHRPDIYEGCPELFTSLMQCCWGAEPGTRPSAQEVLECLKEGAQWEDEDGDVGDGIHTGGADVEADAPPPLTPMPARA